MSLSKPERMVWDDAAHLRLLLTIIAQNEVTPNYKKVAAAFGHGVTTNILAQRMCALRKRAFAITGASPSASMAAATTTPDGTPKKRVGRPPKVKPEGGASSATNTPSKTPRNAKNIKIELALDGEEDDDDLDMSDFKTEDIGGPTTPPQTPGKLHAEPCTPSRARATQHDKVKHGRVGKKQKPRVSPRKRNAVTSYNEGEDMEAFILDSDAQLDIEGTSTEHAYGVVLGEKAEEYDSDSSAEDEYLLDELDEVEI